MMSVIGYSLDAQDNDSDMFEDDAPLETCPRCGYRLNFEATNPDYQLRNKKKRDISATYDGQLIVSKSFRDFCLEKDISGAEFRPFRRDSQHFHFVVQPQIKFDSERTKTRFLKLCAECGNYESVIGSFPCYLQRSGPLEPGFFRTDLLFASGNEKSPIILVAPATKVLLEKSGLKGLEFESAHGSEP